MPPDAAFASPPLAARIAQTHAQLAHPSAPFALATYPQADGSFGQRFAQAPTQLTHWLDAGRAYGQQPFIHYWNNRSGDLPPAPQVWTYADFFCQVDSWAQWLKQDLQLAAGCRAAILAANSPEWIAAFAASVYTGAVAAPLNSMNTARDSLHTLAELAPSVLFCDHTRLAGLLQALQQPECAAIWQPCPIVLIGEGSIPADCQNAALQIFLAPAANPDALPLKVERSAADDALIVYTSGSAALPKGAVFTHDAVCQALQNLEYIGAFAALSSPLALQKIMAAALPPCLLSCVPYFHVSGLYAQVLSTLKNGRKLVLLPRWNPAHALELIASERATAISAAPTMIAQLMAQPDFGQPAVTGSLSALGFGGSAVPPALQQAVAEHMPNSLCGTGFGMTETGGAGAGASGDVFMANRAASGIVSPIMQVQILDENGQAQPTGTAGEICLRGPTLMRAYWQRPAESEQALQGGWMHTGDWGYLDEDNYLYISGRIKEVINRHGEKIAASEVEAALAAHPAVREVAVLPLPDAVSLECVAAVVVLHQATANAQAIRALEEHARLLLPAYKVPCHWHISTQALPRNAMHKVLKKDLPALFTALPSLKNT
jgi:long-chain acyl-CoA synthetase